MKVFALFCLVFLAPCFAMEVVELEDESTNQLYQDRIREAKSAIQSLQKAISSSLSAKPDLFAPLPVKLAENIHRLLLEVPPTDPLVQDLERFMKVAVPPEYCFTEAEAIKLISKPCTDHFIPLTRVTNSLKRILTKWQTTSDHVSTLLLAVNQSLWFQKEWHNLRIRVYDKISSSTLCKEDLLEIYEWVKYFHTQSKYFKTSLNNLLQNLRQHDTSAPDTLSQLDWMLVDLKSFADKNGDLLWCILRHSLDLPDLPETYQDIPEDYFVEKSTPVSKFLNSLPKNAIAFVDEDEQIPPPPPPPQEVISSPRAAPMSPRRAVQSLSPRFRRAQVMEEPAPPQRVIKPGLKIFKDGSEGNVTFLARFVNIFSQIPDWEEKVRRFKLQAHYFLTRALVLNPLKPIDTCFADFRGAFSKPTKDRDLVFQRNFVTPKACLRMLGGPIQRISQTTARTALSWECFGPFCFGTKNASEDNIVGEKVCKIGDLTVSKKDTYPFKVGNKYFRYWFERMFGLDSEPIEFGVLDEVMIDTPTVEQNRFNAPIKNFIENPASWTTEKRHEFVGVRRSNANSSFMEWLISVSTGNRAFGEIDPISVGMRVLFSILSQAHANPINLSVEPVGGKFILKRTGFDPFLQPTFQLAQYIYAGGRKICLASKWEDGMIGEEIYHVDEHVFIGRNILYLAFGNDIIPEDVKEKFVKNALPLMLAHLMDQLEQYQIEFDEISSQYKLKQNTDFTFHNISNRVNDLATETEDDHDEVSEAPVLDEDVRVFAIDDSEAASLGLNISGRPETVRQLLQTFNMMVAKLKTRITYLELLKYIHPHEGYCYEIFLKNGEKEVNNAMVIHFFEMIIPEILKQLRQWVTEADAYGERVRYKLDDLDKFNKYTKESLESLSKISCINLKTLVEEYPQNVKEFFVEKFDWACQRGAFRAKACQMAWDLIPLDGFDQNTAYEDIIRGHEDSSPMISWDKVPMLRLEAGANYACMESTHPLDFMREDLIEETDINTMTLEDAIKYIDLVLKHLPNPNHDRVHFSWKRILEEARKGFLALPPRVLTYFQERGFAAATERDTQTVAQLVRFRKYGDLAHVDADSVDPVGVACQLFRQQWIGSLEMGQQDVNLLNAIINLLLLPPVNPAESGEGNSLEMPVRSCGFAVNEETKGGIFKLKYRVGDHFLLVAINQAIGLLESQELLSFQARIHLLSHSIPLLHLHWLKCLKDAFPATEFHPWYVKVLLDKSFLLQDVLTKNLHLTFKDILEALWPELYYAATQKLKSKQATSQEFWGNQAEETIGLSPIENKDTDLDWIGSNGKNLATMLQEWEDIHFNSVCVPPHSLNDSANECLARFNPELHGTDVIIQVLALADQFDIQVNRINSALWQNPAILVNLVQANAPVACIRLATELRLRYLQKSIAMRIESGFFSISGLFVHDDKESLAVLNELINLFPRTAVLDLSKNQICSLAPILPSLERLSELQTLALNENHLHNVSRVNSLKSLRMLTFNNNFIPNVASVQDLRVLMGCPEGFKKPLENIQCEQTGDQAQLKIGFTAMDVEELVAAFLNLWKGKDNKGTESISKMIYILEILYERNCKAALMPEALKDLPPLQELQEFVKAFDPRDSLYKLLFALKWHLPPETNPHKLVLNGFTCEANCLERLEISGGPFQMAFLKTLPQFECLTDLYLINTRTPKLLEDLPVLPKLRILDLTGNQITTLVGLYQDRLPKFKGLLALVLANNLIETDVLSGQSLLSSMLNLRLLNLANNRFRDLPLIRSLPLVRFNITMNHIPADLLNGYQNTGDFFYTPQNQ
ncbi:MAG: hypothetical protein K2Y18_03445 [Alphaproteobacteria bacterium]|nr:hypothetical protein [Alphaproteobacteria bacterium]